MEKDLLNKLKTAVAAIGQSSLFNDPLSELESACEDFLTYRGYRVVKSQKYVHTKVDNTKGLVELFYSLLDKKLDGMNYFDSYRNSLAQDLATAKRFVESRMEANGVGRDVALKECANIIQTVFRNYDEFKFKYSISFSIFGQKKMGWVTEKALQILNRSIEEDVRDRAEARIQETLAQQANEMLGYSDLDELLEKIKEEESGD